MREHHEHDEVVSPAPRVSSEQVDVVTTDPHAGRNEAAYKVTQAIYLIFGVIEGLVAIRFILRLLAANPEAGFAAFIYQITAPLLVPFIGLFGTPRFEGSTLELHSIVAIIVYALVGWLLAKLAWLLLSDTRSEVRAGSTRIHRDVS